jgi:hypothetical protein
MFTIALVAFLLWGARMSVRSIIYFRLARDYGTYERQWREMSARDRAMPDRKTSISAVWGEDIAAFYAPLARKYRQAMWRPWVPVEPDPPAPTFGKSN